MEESLEFLKSRAYDTIAQMEDLKRILEGINAEIIKKVKAGEAEEIKE